MTSKELVHNAPLSGAELKKILRRDFDKLLDNEGVLVDSAAFGRVGYELILRTHLDNPYHPHSSISYKSRPAARNLIEGGFRDISTDETLPPRPELAAIDSPPLSTPSEESTLGELTLHRDIISPNAERLRNDLPVPVLVTQQDGTKTIEHIKYPKGQDVGEGEVSITDTTSEARKAYDLPPLASDSSSSEPPSPGPSLETLCHCSHIYGNHALSGICTQCKEPTPCLSFRDARIPLPEEEQTWPTVPS